MTTPPDFNPQNLTHWLIVVAVAALGWFGKAWRSDTKEVREMLRTDARENREAMLAMSREQSEAMHAAAAALDRSTERDKENDRLIQENTEALRRVELQLQSLSGRQ